jgi:hypothetical protein
MRNSYTTLIGKPEGKRPPGRPRRRWEDNMRMDIREIMWKVVDWMRVAIPCEHGNEISRSIKCEEFLD